METTSSLSVKILEIRVVGAGEGTILVRMGLGAHLAVVREVDRGLVGVEVGAAAD